ncbi:MAG: TerC family protein [Deltaproteobacteria bacterium]|nr:TerC family protein [Deltaproteobacteria bacterium]
MPVQSVGSPLLWLGFTVFVLVMLVIDLGVFHREERTIRSREALAWVGVWVSLAMLFNLGIYFKFGSEKALEFLTGYLIEEALSVDNLFVFLVLFSYFRVPARLQHRVLFWGIVGAIVLRLTFILLGSALLQRFHWVMYVFGGFLLITGLKLLAEREEGEMHPERNPVLRLFRRFVPMVPDFRGGKFLVVENGKRMATPLLAVLVTVEATDVVFAVDSVPAIFAVTTDPFIIFTSNIFAILGLRSLFFLLSNMMEKFHYLKTGLGLILVFVGAKMVLADIYKIPITISLAVILTLLVFSVVISLLIPPPHSETPTPPPEETPGKAPPRAPEEAE